MYEDVVDFIVKKHRGQVRKHSGLPYVFHPIEVTKKLVSLEINDEVILKAALCHDILEDTETEYDELVSIIGIQAANIVEELTYSKTKYSSKEEYIRSFESKSIESIKIKIVDRYCNTIDFYEAGNESYAIEYLSKIDYLIKIYFDISSLSRGPYFKYDDRVFIRFLTYIEGMCETGEIL